MLQGQGRFVSIMWAVFVDRAAQFAFLCKIFLFSTASKLILRFTQPPIQWVRGVLSPSIKRSESEADYSPPSSAEVENGWSIQPLPHMPSWHSAQLIKHRNNFTFFLAYFWEQPTCAEPQSLQANSPIWLPPLLSKFFQFQLSPYHPTQIVSHSYVKQLNNIFFIITIRRGVTKQPAKSGYTLCH
jgi:hypothetical protein